MLDVYVWWYKNAQYRIGSKADTSGVLGLSQIMARDIGFIYTTRNRPTLLSSRVSKITYEQ
jgi:hypothetical protein